MNKNINDLSDLLKNKLQLSDNAYTNDELIKLNEVKNKIKNLGESSNRLSAVVRSLQAGVKETSGYKDKNNRDIYEGALLKIVIYKMPLIVIYHRGLYRLYFDKNINSEYNFLMLDEEWAAISEIIGDINDNPELLNDTPAN